MKMSSSLLSAALLAVLTITITHRAFAHDEDFGFDFSGDFEVEIDGGSKKLWGGNKEITAHVGKAFHLSIPKEAFGREVDSYEAKQSRGDPLPSWLLFDKSGGTFWGVPLTEDVGALHLIVRSIGGNKPISEELLINVIEPPIDVTKCPTTEDNTVLTLLIDKGVRAIKPKQRVIAINNIAKFFGLPFSAFSLKSQIGRDDITDSSVVLAGPGNLRVRTSKITSFLEVAVGCDGRLWLQTAPLIHQLKQQARDGTITEVIGLPLVGWRVKTETKSRSKREAGDLGSGDYDEYYDEDYEDDYDEDSIVDETTSSKTSLTTPPTTTSTITSQTHPHRHHHGEPKNSEDNDFSVPVIHEQLPENSNPKSVEATNLVTLAMTPETTPATTSTTTTTEKPTIVKVEKIVPLTSSSTTAKVEATTRKVETSPPVEDDYDYEYGVDEEDDDEEPVESLTVVPDLTAVKQTSIEPRRIEPVTTSTMKTTTKEVFIPETIPPTTSTTSTTEEPTSVIVEDTESATMMVTEPLRTEPPSTTIPTTTTVATTTTTTTMSTTTFTTTSTTPIPIIPTIFETTTEEITSTEIPTVKQVVFSTPHTTTVRDIPEVIEYGPKNFLPEIENRIQQMSVIAGKIFRFVIPKNTFKDFEDGYNLTLEFLNSKEQPIDKDSWCHFNPARREIYGLPLEEDVSKWEYVLRATDREGASIQDRFTIQVQQHKSQRVVNHEFSMHIRVEKPQEFPHYVDWCLKALRALGRIYNTNMTEITVRHLNYSGGLAVFTWTNDSVPTNHCPTSEIENLFKILTANDRGDPSRELNLALAPELRVKKVEKRGLGVCEVPLVPELPPSNLGPFLRNPVDQINATVGELLIFKVPADTFYDPEDTYSSTLNLSLLTGDRQPIKSGNWLQFDAKNWEFFGIPRKAGRTVYQLVCVDSGGLPASDSLQVVVYPAPKIPYNVEFTMTVVTTPVDALVTSASLQRKFVEKLLMVFGDRNASYIHFNQFKQKYDTTIISWHNKSLTTAKCPHEEISHLESMMRNSDKSVSNHVYTIMQPEFPISAISLVYMGNCKITKPHVPIPPPEDMIPIETAGSETSSDQYQYLMTFIVPVVIISIMLFLAGIAACVLYRRRRTGKMNVEEDGRQSYGNKGIPVIFQEELEEKPEPGTKTPVILKDEKPPLAPPEYSKSGSLKLTDDSEPYQPPPPFTRAQDNGRQPRPKPTPTYRKPPPYVPP